MHKNYQKSGDTNDYNLHSLRKCKETNFVSFGTYYNLLQTMRNDTAKINLAMTSLYIEIGTEYETISLFGVARETGNYLFIEIYGGRRLPLENSSTLRFFQFQNTFSIFACIFLFFISKNYLLEIFQIMFLKIFVLKTIKFFHFFPRVLKLRKTRSIEIRTATILNA